MRPVHLSDLHFAALALAQIPPDQRTAAIDRALRHADIADRYRKRLRRGHPTYGTGTLTSAIWDGDPLQAPKGATPTYLQCLLIVVTAVLERSDSQTA